ncbi:MAG: PASTA domain-containing protein [Actinomycetota bacterium]
MNDVRELLREAVGEFEPRGDQRSVEDRVERRRRRRQVSAGVVALGVFVAAGLLAWTAFRPGETTPGSTGSGAYQLSRFEVGPHIEAGDSADPTRAVVKFTMRWSSEVYPGVHRCGLRILDPTGSELGSLSLELVSLSRSASREMTVPVSGSIEGAMATGSCEPWRLDARVAVLVSNARVVLSAAGPSIAYDAHVPPGIPEGLRLGAQACTAAVWSNDDRLLGSARFASTGVPEGVLDEIGLDEGPAVGEAVQATVTCVPYTREDGFPEPKPPSPTSSPSVAILVPDVVGLSPAEARARLDALGLGVSVTAGPSEEIARGLVAVQLPAAGVEVTPGSFVTIEVSQGSPSDERSEI